MNHHSMTRNIVVNLVGLALVTGVTIAGAALGFLLNGGGPTPSEAETSQATSSTSTQRPSQPHPRDDQHKPQRNTGRFVTSIGGSVSTGR